MRENEGVVGFKHILTVLYSKYPSFGGINKAPLKLSEERYAW